MFKAKIEATKKDLPTLADNAKKYLTNKKINEPTKFITHSGITSADNKIKDTTKVIKCFKNGRILLKEITKKLINQKRGFLGYVLRPLMKVSSWLMKNVLALLAKYHFMLIRLTPAASGTDAAVQKKIHESGITALIISNKGMTNITKVVKSLDESVLLIKGVSKIIENEAK